MGLRAVTTEVALYRVLCAWCGKDLGETGADDDSHGICEVCRVKVIEDFRRQLQENEGND